MKKFIAIVITLIFIFNSTGYCLRVPVSSERGGREYDAYDRVILSEKLKREGPWQTAKESNNRLKPIFISEEHTDTLIIVEKAIEEAIIDPKKAFVINFDRHENRSTDDTLPMANNWLRILENRKEITGYKWVDAGEKAERLEDLDMEPMKRKDIIISIDMDYFENIVAYRLQEHIEQLISFIERYRESIKLITIAYSSDYCLRTDPKKNSKKLLNLLNANVISEGWFKATVAYLLEYGVCDLYSKQVSVNTLLRGVVNPRDDI